MRRKHPDKEDLQYYSLSLGGYSYREIAAIFGTSVRTAWLGVRRAKIAEEAKEKAARAMADAVAAALAKKAAEERDRKPRDPHAEILFGPSCKPWAQTTCADIHPNGPIPEGSSHVCGVCHQYGRDDHPALQIDHLAAPKPEPKPTAAPLTRESGKERRKRERREAAARSARTQPGRPPR